MQPGLKITFLNRVFPPAEGATGQHLAELARNVAEEGHESTIISSRLSNPQVGRRCPQRAADHRVRVERVHAFAFGRKTLWQRALSYLSLYPAMLWRALRLQKPDVIVSMTDPPLQLLLGTVLKIIYRYPHVHWAQDIYPELAEELGLLNKHGLIALILRWLSTAAMTRCDAVVAVGECMKARLLARGVPEPLIHVIPNWAVRGVGAADDMQVQAFRRKHDLDGRFVVMYSGNLGLAHDFRGIIDAASELQNDAPQVLFLFIGNGPQLATIQDQVRIRSLKNVRFLPFQPAEELSASLAAADLHFVCMREDLCGLVVPSKVYGALASRRPCLFAGPIGSEAAQAILHSGRGTVVPEADGIALANAILSRVAKRDNASEGVEPSQFGVQHASNAFQDILKRICLSEKAAVSAPSPQPSAPRGGGRALRAAAP